MRMALRTLLSVDSLLDRRLLRQPIVPHLRDRPDPDRKVVLRDRRGVVGVPVLAEHFGDGGLGLLDAR